MLPQNNCCVNPLGKKGHGIELDAYVESEVVKPLKNYTSQHTTVGMLVRAVGVINNPNCAFYDTSMKLVSLIEFEVLKKIGSGPQYQSASKHDFQAFRFGPRPPGSFCGI